MHCRGWVFDSQQTRTKTQIIKMPDNQSKINYLEIKTAHLLLPFVVSINMNHVKLKHQNTGCAILRNKKESKSKPDCVLR